MNDAEILEDSDFFEDLLEKQSNLQCYLCGGWYWFDDCAITNDTTKQELQRYIELT